MVLLTLIFVFLVGCEATTGTVTVEGKEEITPYSSSSISEENYESESYGPRERDFLDHTMVVLEKLDNRDYGSVGDYFVESFHDQKVPIAPYVEAYESNKFKPENVEVIDYEIYNKKYIAYDDEAEGDVIKEPYDIDTTSEGVKWATYTYEIAIEFEFDLIRNVKLTNDKIIRDAFKISGAYPVVYSSFGTGQWYLGEFEIEKVDENQISKK